MVTYFIHCVFVMKKEPFTLDFSKSHLFQRVDYLPQLTNERFDPTCLPSLVACSTFLLSSPCALRLNSEGRKSISIALKPLLMLLALPLSIKHISINRKSHFSLAEQGVTCKLFN
ncbi:hypothetical protein T03_12762 [Trichinella britovi]|uniref:Uncharacterized protein n=1 Tax=Trichinella britovi TaxID=45882 RepID=A0A0V1DI52_TRIBR|nr:hypothetical protein T03_12762 [Trichinella britovi]